MTAVVPSLHATRMSPAQRRLTRAAPQRAAGFTSTMATVRGLRLHVRHRADPDHQTTWVLLHGLAVSHRYLMPTAAALPGQVYVPDLPGFGLSENPAAVLTPAQHADILATWMDETGLDDANLLGNSFGCQVAVELAIARPDLAGTLILVGPTVDPAAPTSGAQIRRFTYDLLSEDPHQIPMIAADVRDSGLPRILRTLRHAVAQHMERRIPLVAAPILVLRGEHDPIAPPEWVTQAAALARIGSAGVIPGAAHNAVTTAGVLVAERAVGFVRSHAARHMRLDHATPAAEARRLAEQALNDWHLTDRSDDVLLVTTELVQNVTQHTEDGGELRLRLQDDAVIVEVTDTDPRPPRLKPIAPLVPGGRGLRLVAAAARTWGSRPAAWAGRTGKIVWVEIAKRLPR
ncbi:MAG: alpha/beta fold hydrolase [Actinoplanes sp.]